MPCAGARWLLLAYPPLQRWVSAPTGLSAPGAAHTSVFRITDGDYRGKYPRFRSHALTNNLLHCVFSTKDRANLIPDPPRLSQYLGGIATEKNIPLIIAGGTNNHVHLLMALPAAISLAEAIRDLKGNSSRWMTQQGSAFAWQEGYGNFSVSVEQEGGHRIHRKSTAPSREAKL